jgi:BMFP domain-containing protein YqiC
MEPAQTESTQPAGDTGLQEFKDQIKEQLASLDIIDRTYFGKDRSR